MATGRGRYPLDAPIGPDSRRIPVRAVHDRCSVKVHNAVATSAAIGLPVALASAIGYVYAGWSAPDLPRYSLGYVYLPAMAGIVAMSTLVAPLGARVAHAWPVRRLRRTFSLLLWILGAWMWWKALRS